jgi:hypothetical protein
MTFATQNNSRWEVMWVVKKGKEPRIICKEFDHDFVSALELYSKLKIAGKKMATLRCCNVGYAPPDRFRDSMMAYNRQGVWWCPYCMQLRRFEKRAWYEVDERLIADDPKYYCPMCDISHSDGNVRKYNPLAQNLMNRRRSRGRKAKHGRRKRKR